MQEPAMPIIIHDLVGQEITMTIPLDALPSDQQMEDNTILGILDQFDSPAKKLYNLIMAKYPASDEQFYYSNPGDVSKLNIKNNSDSDDDQEEKCDCADPNCPRKATIHPLELMMMRNLLTARSLDLSKWEPFKYPILSISTPMWRMLGQVMDEAIHEQSQKKHFNFLRLANAYELDTSVRQMVKILPHNGGYDMLEAIYFPKGWPDQFELLSNENPNAIIRPTRKYNFIGLPIRSGYSFASIGFPANIGKIEFAIIGWIGSEEKLCDAIRENKITTKFNEPESGQEITCQYQNEMCRWVSPK